MASTGRRPAKIVQALGLPADVPRYGIASSEWNETQVLVARCEPLGGDGYTLYPPAAHTAALLAACQAAGATMLEADTFEIVRVEHGYPRFGREITLDYIPLEADLWRAVSFQKGCYVGQEIIARMESRGRIAKQLRGLRLPAAPNLCRQKLWPMAKRLAI